MYYAGRVVLNMSEQEFWKTTPRILDALVSVHAEVNDPESRPKNKKGYIDEIF